MIVIDDDDDEDDQFFPPFFFESNSKNKIYFQNKGKKTLQDKIRMVFVFV